MAEYIEREAAIDAVLSCFGTEDSIFSDATVMGIGFKIKDIPAADVQPVKWIPVTERLPEKNGSYLYITGERKAEGGARAGRHSNCFEKSHGLDHYMPLWFWDNATKEWYVLRENIRHSDCYEVYGLQRTGCVGCPFGKDVFAELEIMQKYEPKCYKLCMNVFGEGYELTKKYREFVACEKQAQLVPHQYVHINNIKAAPTIIPAEPA